MPFLLTPYYMSIYVFITGKVVSGYRVRNGQWTLIGRQSPQLPQVCRI